MAAQMSRAFGMSSISSLVKLVPTLVFFTSTTGDSPVMVSVSSTPARGIWVLMVTVVARLTRISSRRTVWKPESSKTSV